MKCVAIVVGINEPASLPSRGAWIEIAATPEVRNIGLSLPSRGAWIEIPLITISLPFLKVAPLAGGVD